MKDVILDIEANDLLENVTQLHSVVLRDVDTNEVLSCTDHGNLLVAPEHTAEMLDYPDEYKAREVLEKAERIYGHNLIGYDRPALKKLLGFEIPWEKVRDTQIIAQLRFAHIKELDYENQKKGKPGVTGRDIGSHSLKAWGIRLGVHKGDMGTKDFSRWTPQMQEYCEQDTAVTRELVLYLRKQQGITPEAVEIEQGLREYLCQQELNGWPFDLEKAIALQAKLAARRQELHQELCRVFGAWYQPVRKGGQVEVVTSKVNNTKRGIEKGVQYTKVERVEFNPSSRHHIANRLIKLYGWVPEAYTPSGQPEVNETSLKNLDQTKPGVNLLAEYLLVQKRLGQLAEGKEAWIPYATKERPWGGQLTGLHHIHGGVKQNGTITHRGAHLRPNMAQVPTVNAPYGAECRSLFIVPPGWVEIGSDAAALEARCLAHYLAKYDGGAYGQILLTGDVHTANRIALGFPEGKEWRSLSKVWFYAFLYGAGDVFLGGLIEPRSPKAVQKNLGAKTRRKFLKNLPALGRLVEDVKKASEKGYLVTIDGRYVFVRSEHSALNTLLQSSGSVICKRWGVNFAKRLTEDFGPQGWDGKWAALAWVHDEYQVAVRPEIEARVKDILIEEMRALTGHFKWRVPLDGEAKSGSSWSACH